MKSIDSAIGMNGHRRRDLYRTAGDAIVVEIVFGAISSRWKPSNGRAHHALAVILERRHISPQRWQPILRRQLEQALLAAFDRHDLGQKIALALHRSSHIGQNQVQQLAIHAAAAHQQHGRNPDAFLIDLARQWHGARAHSSDVGMMRAIRYIKRRFAAAL